MMWGVVKSRFGRNGSPFYLLSLEDAAAKALGRVALSTIRGVW